MPLSPTLEVMGITEIMHVRTGTSSQMRIGYKFCMKYMLFFNVINGHMVF